MKKILDIIKEMPQVQIVELKNDIAVPFANLKSFILLCDQLNVAITGFEGVYLRDTHIIPSIKHIADFSSLAEKYKRWSQFQTASIHAAMLFAENVPGEGLYFIPGLKEKK